MKKFLPLLFLSILIFAQQSNVCSAEPCLLKGKPPIEHNQNMKQKFEQRLKLTDEQKEKARKIHEKGFKQMKPIMLKSDQLRKEIAVVKKSNEDENTKNKKIQKYITELRKLDKKAEDIRRTNSQEFEKILTKDQKIELEKMKAEGRKNFSKRHRPRPPFNMFAPDFGGFKGFRPMMPPPQEF